MKRVSLLLLFGYAILTVVMTWPTAAQMTLAIPGDGFDGWQNYWNLWWIKEALLNRQTHFFFTDILYPPLGTSLLFHTLNFFNGLWSLPLQINFGLAAAYNSVVFFHFILSGYGVYLLALYVLTQLGLGSRTGRRWAAFAAGLIFTFSPFHMAHLLGHMQVFSLTWPPFYILWMLKLLNQWRLTATNQRPEQMGIVRRDLALAGLFLALTTMIDWYQTLYMLLFTVLAVVWALWSVWRAGTLSPSELLKPVVGLVGMGLVFGLLFSPLIVPMAVEAATADYMRPSFEENVVLSADLLAFVLPSELHPLWGEAIRPAYEGLTTTTSERLIFAGFVPLLLGVIGIFYYRQRRLVQFWMLFTLSFFVLALGPFLHVAGRIVQVGGTNLPLPYLFLYRIVPFIGISRSLSRFDLMVMIGLGVLAAIGLTRFKRPWQAAAIVLICFEFIAIPYPMTPIDTHDLYYQLGQEAEDYTIVALPMNWDRPSPLLYQTAHRKRLLTAYTSRQNPLDLSWRTPVLQQWRTLNDDIIQADLAAIAPTVLHDFKVRYIVLDYFQMPTGSEREATETWVAAALPNAAPVYADERLAVYQAPPLTERQPYLQLGDGWSDLQSVASQPARTIAGEATFKIIGHTPEAARLEIETIAPHQLSRLVVQHGQSTLTPTISADGLQTVIMLPPADQTQTLTLQTDRPLPISTLHLVIP